MTTERLSPLIAVNPISMHPFTAAKCISSLANLYSRKVFLNMVAGTALSPWTLTPDGSRLVYEIPKGSDAGLWAVSLDWSDAARPKAGSPEPFMTGVPFRSSVQNAPGP